MSESALYAVVAYGEEAKREINETVTRIGELRRVFEGSIAAAQRIGIDGVFESLKGEYAQVTQAYLRFWNIGAVIGQLGITAERVKRAASTGEATAQLVSIGERLTGLVEQCATAIHELAVARRNLVSILARIEHRDSGSGLVDETNNALHVATDVHDDLIEILAQHGIVVTAIEEIDV
ncbi:MAG TPA: hypothetical protein VIP77_01430 [Jiangellaceae bacterium]